MYVCMYVCTYVCMYVLPVGYPCDKKSLGKKNDDELCDDELCM